MAYPVFDVPMFRSLLDVSVDTFVPNLALLPPNSLTLLENNYEFIEAYLAGLNHEMARELLWREFPTDQRGTPFRQFWDPRALPLGPGATARHPAAPPVVARPPGGQRRPPSTATSSSSSAASCCRSTRPPPSTRTGPDGRPVRATASPTASSPAAAGWSTPPPAEHIKLPLYEANVDPDIYLLGFDLTAEQARGGPDDPGWFFVLKERPGDPRFGVDDGPPVPVEVWNDLTWSDVDPTGRGFSSLDPAVTVALAGFDGSDDDAEKADQRAEDENLPAVVGGAVSSADLAYLLFQVPVMVAVHAKEMVPR